MNIFEQQKQFMIACSQPVSPKPMLSTDRHLWMKLIREEIGELHDAMDAGDIVEAFDAIIDSIYVLSGLGNAMGLPLQAGFDEVHKTNMAKAVPIETPDGITLAVKRRDDGKILKPLGWAAPDLAKIIQQVSI